MTQNWNAMNVTADGFRDSHAKILTSTVFYSKYTNSLVSYNHKYLYTKVV